MTKTLFVEQTGRQGAYTLFFSSEFDYFYITQLTAKMHGHGETSHSPFSKISCSVGLILQSTQGQSHEVQHYNSAEHASLQDIINRPGVAGAVL